MLAALAQDLERAVPTLEVEVADVGAQRFGDAQAVEGPSEAKAWSRAEPRLAWTREAPSSLRSRPRGPGLVVDLGTTDVDGWAALDKLLLLAVLVEAGQSGQAPGHGRAHAPCFSSHRPYSSRWARRTPNSVRLAWWHQLENRRRSVA